MSKFCYLLFQFSIGFLFFGAVQASELNAYKQVLLLMGTRFEITAVTQDEKLAIASIDSAIAEIQRIENKISSWKDHSETSQINRMAGIQPVIVSSELFYLIKRAKKISDLSEGLFDISFAAIDALWKFDGNEHQMPDQATLLQSVSKINYQNIILNETDFSVFLKEKGMKIGFGAIGKGYAANKAMEVMKKMGIENGIVNASGDLITWGKDENEQDWSIGIAHPKEKNKVLGWLVISNMSVVTSGNYEKYFMGTDGKRYGHIINPKTGMPASGTKSVTIISPDAELSDALATTVFVMGPEKGIAFINTLKNVSCFIVDENDELHYSKNLKINYYSLKN